MSSREKRKGNVTASSRPRETKSFHGDHQRRRSDTKGWGYLFYRWLCHAVAATAEPKNTLLSRHAVHSSLNFDPFEFQRSGKYLRDWKPVKKNSAVTPTMPTTHRVFRNRQRSFTRNFEINFYLMKTDTINFFHF